jgi:hypothetical protein
MTDARLRDRALRLDADRFVGRVDALSAFDRLVDPLGEARLMLVHGPGGIGKSALLRELRRRAGSRGMAVTAFDGRVLPTAADLLTSAIAPEAGARRPLVVIDEVEALGIGLPALRQLLLDALRDDARVVLAGRIRPDRVWLADALDGLVLDVPLSPMNPEEARELLLRRGVADPVRQDTALGWAEGFPLALALTAESGDADDTRVGDDLERRLIRHLAGTEIDGVDRELLLVAALTWAVDARLVAAALPGRNTRGDIGALLGLSLTQQVGNRVVLHPLLAQALRTLWISRDPAYYRTVKVRIADHLAGRAHGGELAAFFELVELIDDPDIRRWMSRGASPTHYADGLRDGDLDEAVASFGDRGAEWVERVRTVATEVPEFTTSVRRSDGGLAAVAIHVGGDRLDPSDPVAAVIAAHMRRTGIETGQALAGLGTVILDPENDVDEAEAVRVGIPAAIQRVGNAAMRYLYVSEWTGRPAPAGFFDQLGFIELDVGLEADGLPIRLWFRDFGPGGQATFYHSIVRIENGEPPLVPHDRVPLLAELDAARSTTNDVIRRALRDRLAAVFGSDPVDRQLRSVLEVCYLNGPFSEAAALERLHLSRSTLYRQLRMARQRLAAAELGAAELRPPRH